MNSVFNYTPIWFVALYVFLVGLCFGSFLNVVVLRGLSGEGLVFERSKCPKCGNKLAWYMNIPLISYLFLRGKCAFCKSKISIQYPLVEFICASLFLFSYFQFGLTFKFLFSCIFLFMFLALGLTDILEMVVLELHTYILLGCGLIWSLFNLGFVDIKGAIIGAILSYLIFYLLNKITIKFFKMPVFGSGDGLIALGLGSIFGIKNFLIVLIMSIFLQGLFFILPLLKKTIKEKKYNLFISYFLTIFIIIIYSYLYIFKDLVKNENYIFYVIPMILILMYSLFSIIKDIKSNISNLDIDENETVEQIEEKYINSDITTIPFGPAFVLSAGVCWFYLEQIKDIVKNFIF